MGGRQVARPESFAAVKSVVGLTWPQAMQWPEPVWKLWEQKLSVFPQPAVLRAIEVLAEEGDRFPPTWGTVAKRVREALGLDAPTFEMAWREVMDARSGWGNSGCWSHPAVGLFVRQFGWQRIGLAPSEEGFGFTQFMARAKGEYEAAAHRERMLDGDERRKLLAFPFPNSQALTGRYLRAIDAGNVEEAAAVQRAITESLRRSMSHTPPPAPRELELVDPQKALPAPEPEVVDAARAREFAEQVKAEAEQRRAAEIAARYEREEIEGRRGRHVPLASPGG
jgi:hypothetical protein